MAVVLFANVGTSDILDQGERVESIRAHARTLLDLLERPDTGNGIRDLVQLPLLEPCIEHIRRVEGRLDHVVLFVTDQGDGVEEKYRQKDTILAGEVIKILLTRDLLGLGQSGPVQLEVIRQNPADPEAMFYWFRRRIPEVLGGFTKAHGIGRPDRLYVEMTGGTPACTHNLVLSLLEAEYPLTTLYVSEAASASGKILAREYGSALRGNQILGVLEHLLEADNYAGALELVRSTPFRNRARALCFLLEGLNHRQCFAFREAKRCFEAALEDAPDLL